MKLLKTILKVALILILCVAAPILLVGILGTVGIALPIIGIVLIIFFPVLVIGIVIGHCCKKD